MKKIVVAVVLSLAASLGAHAGTSVNWYFNWGMYPHGASDLSSTATGDGVAATQDVLWQLIYAGDDGSIDPVNIDNPGYVGGDDQVIFTRTVLAGGSGDYDEFLFGTASTPSTNGNSYAVGGQLYMRVFGSTSPVLHDYYYNSALTPFVEKNPIDDAPQIFNGNSTFGDSGDALNIEIIAVPEPSTVALMLAGLAMVGYRRFRRA